MYSGKSVTQIESGIRERKKIKEKDTLTEMNGKVNSHGCE
jgi:hypothetical protein